MQLWWTQEDLADKSGVSVPTILRLERKEPGSIRKATLFKLAEALEVKPERLAYPNVVAP
jgi:transcriptional regulator with XRE-family HTH domain